MAYINFIMGWKNQDLQVLKEICDPGLKVFFVDSDNQQIVYDYHQFINLLDIRFRNVQDWQFDIITRYNRNDEELILSNVTRENSQQELIEPLAFCIFTFKKCKEPKLIRMYMETKLNQQ